MERVCKAILVGLSLLLWEGISRPAAARERWHTGEVHLVDGSVVRGQIRYLLNEDQVWVRNGRITRAYGTRQAEGFSFYDTEAHAARQFRTLLYRKRNTYPTPAFFEILRTGGVTLLNREEEVDQRIFYNGKAAYSPYTGSNYLAVTDTYFVLDARGEVRRFRGKTAEWKALSGEKAAVLCDYLKQQRLRMDNRSHVLRAFDFLETLQLQVENR